MLKGNESHVAAKFFKDGFVLHSFAVLREREQVDLMFGGEFAQKMKSPVMRAAIERIRNVRIEDEQLHDLIEMLP